MRTCVIIPALNEADTVGGVIDSVRRMIPEALIVVVNDGSTDRTGEIAREYGAIVLSPAIRLGIGGAVQAGLKFAVRAGCDLAVQVDGDGQHPADQLPILLKPITSGAADAVIGSRFLGESEYRAESLRMHGIRLFRSAHRLLTGQSITDPTSGFRAYNARALSYLADYYPQDYPEPQSLIELHRQGFRIREVAVSMKARESGQSSINLSAAAYYMIKVLIANLVAASRRGAKPSEV